MSQIKFDPKVIEQCKQLDKDGAALQHKAFKHILIAFAIYFVALGLTIADIIPSWLMYAVTAGTIIVIWHSNGITTRGRKMQYKSFRLIDAEMMRLFREYAEGKK